VREYKHAGGESYRVELRALPDDDAPAHVRLRQALKCLLRSFRLRCTAVVDTTLGLPPLPTTAPPPVANGVFRLRAGKASRTTTDPEISA
jgi:hypothetical protein